MTDNRSSGQVAVIGAGPGGLATALMLAARGVDVTIFEARDEVGGRTGRVRLGDHAFDLGPTYFLMPHALQEVLAHAGRRLDREIELRRLDPMYRLVIGQRGGPDVALDATQDLDEMARRIAGIHAADGARFHDFIAHNRRKLAAFEPILRRPIRSALDLARPDALRALPRLHPRLSVQALNERFFEHPATRLAVGFQSKYLGMSPDGCPSLFTILPFIEYEYGVWHPIGGCHALMRMLARLVTEHGGRIRTGTPVEGLELDGRRVTGLRLGGRGAGETFRCAHAVINADATWALRTLVPPERRRRYPDRWIDGARYSCSTYMLYLGVDGEVDLPHHTVRTAPDYERNLEDIGRADGFEGSLSDDPSFYVCNASRSDPSLAPPGRSSVYVLMPAPNCRAPIDWSAESPRVRDRLLDRMRDVLGVDLRGRVRVARRVTPEDWQAMNITVGATFNLAHSFDQMLHRRPQHRLPGCDGAWLVGGGTHPGSGLPVIFLSAQLTARMLLRELGAALPDAAPAPARPTAAVPSPRPALS